MMLLPLLALAKQGLFGDNSPLLVRGFNTSEAPPLFMFWN